jgi:hypothetical protein
MRVCFMNHALSHKGGQIIEKKVSAHRSNTNDDNKKTHYQWWGKRVNIILMMIGKEGTKMLTL